jgi:hypothetical protein
MHADGQLFEPPLQTVVIWRVFFFYYILLSRGRGLRDRRGARGLACDAITQGAAPIPRFPAARFASSLEKSI